MLLFPTLYQISGFAYGLHQNIYALDLPKENRMILFDTGLDENDLSMCYETRANWGLEKRTVSHVFLTHAHFDHSGNASFYEQSGAAVYIGKEDASAVLYGSEGSIYYAYGRSFPCCHTVTVLDGDCTVQVADDLFITCYHVPGHTPGSYLYQLTLSGKTVLITGDFVQCTPDGSGAVPGVLVDEAYSWEQYCISFRKMLPVSCDLLLPGHYQPCLHQGSRLLQWGYRELLVNRRLYR